MGADSADLVAPSPLALLGYNDLPEAWPHIAHLVERACAYSHGAFTPESVVEGMRAGQFFMLVLSGEDDVRGIMVATISTFGSGLRVLECVLVGGEDMDAWLQYEPEMDALARAHGCHRTRAIVRKGMKRKLPHWKLIGEMLERDLT